MLIDKLIAHFATYIPLRNREKHELAKRVVEKKIKRRQFILRENEVCRHYTFVVSGCVRMYGVDKNGVEHNLQFAAENDRPAARWVADIGSFHSEKASQLSIAAIEPSVILQIERSDLIYLYHNHPKFDRIFRVIIENKHIELQTRLLQTISATAQERYLTFLHQYPTLLNRLPNTQIAAYIGITPEFLSKLRRRMAPK